MAKKKSFEQSLARLEEITKDIEDKEIGLENSLKLYKEGVELVSKCLTVLNTAEQEILVLQKDLQQEFQLKSFEIFE